MAKGNYYECRVCEYNGSCSLQSLAPDITGCSGHSKYSTRLAEEQKRRWKEAEEKKAREVLERNEEAKRQNELRKQIKVGSRCRVKASSRGKMLPQYLIGSTVKVIGFNRRGNVICDYDGEKPFHIPLFQLDVIEL